MTTLTECQRLVRIVWPDVQTDVRACSADCQPAELRALPDHGEHAEFVGVIR